MSLLLKLFLLDRNENKKMYPVFLEQLFKNRQRSFADEAEVKDLHIRENLILLGYDSANLPDQTNENVQDETITVNFNGLMDAAAGQLGPNEVKDNARLLIKTRNDIVGKIGGTPRAYTDEELAKAAEEISQYNVTAGVKNSSVNVNRLTIVNRLARLISDKQKLVNLQKRLGGEVEKFDNVRNSSLTAGGNRRLTDAEMASLVAPFENLIENDLFDDLGPGSGSRFIINDDQILSYEFTESDNEVYCRFDVTGQENLISSPEGTVGGVPILWAGATDFDLWRQYGWRTQGAINKPFFRDAELQCAPYALMQLSRMKRNTVKGTLTIAGNEYYQLGDVIYLNTRDMLYYVTGIRQSFSYDGSGSFTTTLDLRYGHPLGDYIATPLDVIGKSLIKNQRFFNTRVTSRETSNKSTGTNIGIVSFPNSTSTDAATIQKEMLSGAFGRSNFSYLKNALSKARAQITTALLPKIEIRGFYVSEGDSNKISTRIGVVKDWFLNPISGFNSSGESIALSKDFGKLESQNIQATEPVNVKQPSEDDIRANRIPKEEVFMATLDGDPTNIIDIVLVFE
jgi:hypothetical protein